MNPISQLGVRLLDLHRDRLTFDDWIKDSDDPEDEAKRLKHCDDLLKELRSGWKGYFYAGTDASLPLTGRHQATARAVLYCGDKEVNRSRYVAGQVLSHDAELLAIRHAIVKALSFDECESLYIFTDSMASARRAVDPTIHSGQEHSVAVCSALEQWFLVGGARHITFVYIPSTWKWEMHGIAHKFVSELRVPVGRRGHSVHAITSYDGLRWSAVIRRTDLWNNLFQDPAYRGRNFLMLNDLEGKVIQPGGKKDSAWLNYAYGSPQLYARVCRCILNHAPIGSYYDQFHLQQSTSCPCGSPWETRSHIFRCKKTYVPPDFSNELQYPSSILYLIGFLTANPKAFAFKSAPSGVG